MGTASASGSSTSTYFCIEWMKSSLRSSAAIFCSAALAGTNAGTRIPPVSEDPYNGSLRCFAINPQTGNPVVRNDLKGEAVVLTGTLAAAADLIDAPVDLEVVAVGIGDGRPPRGDEPGRSHRQRSSRRG